MTEIDPYAPPVAPHVGPNWSGPAPADPWAVPAQPAPAYPQPARRAPVAYQPNEAGWWFATDGLWYPPESRSAQPPPQGQPLVSNPSGHSQTVVVQVGPQGYPGWMPMPPAFVTAPPKTKVAAALLAFFLGCFGAHRFYLGNAGVGVAMLLLTILSLGLLAPLTAVWALIEMVVILCGGMKDSHGRPLT